MRESYDNRFHFFDSWLISLFFSTVSMFVALDNPEHATTYQSPQTDPQSYMWALQKEPIGSNLSHIVETKCPCHGNNEMV